MADSGKDRRTSLRRTVYTAAELTFEEGGEPKTAMTRDVSETGLLLLTQQKLPDEARVTLRLILPDADAPSMKITGTVVRSTGLDDDEIGLWAEKVAFRFDEPNREVAEAVAALADEQAESYHLDGE
jgi:hypothetical protein